MELPYVEEFLDNQRIYFNASKYTIVNYRNDLKIFFGFTKGRYTIRKNTIINYTDYLLNERKEAKSTINRRLSSLKSYFNYIYNEEIINYNPGDNIKFLKLNKPRPKQLPSQDYIFKVLDSINHLRDRALLETLYGTGVREGELSALNIQDVDFENKLLYVFKAKGDEPRVVPISNKALEYIKAYIKSRKEGPLFLNNRYTRLGERSIYNIVTKYFDMPPHDLRHCFATHLLAKTGNLKGVSELLGHSSIEVTERIYTHFNMDNLKEIYNKGGMNDR